MIFCRQTHADRCGQAGRALSERETSSGECLKHAGAATLLQDLATAFSLMATRSQDMKTPGTGDMSNHSELKRRLPKRRQCVNSFFAIINDGLPRHMKYACILGASVVDVKPVLNWANVSSRT